jgi:predicted nucleic acid-binding protein
VTPILIDTNAYAALQRGTPDALLVVQHAPQIAVSSITLCELLAGFRSGSQLVKNRTDLDRFLASPRVRAIVVDAGTAEHYAAIYAELRRMGKPIPTNDMLIAATALQHNLSVFTFDAHFANVPGLKIGRTVAELRLVP